MARAAERVTEPRMLTDITTGKAAWVRRDIAESDYLVRLSADCLDEIRRTVEELRAYPLPLVLLSPDDYPLDACRAAMRAARRILDEGVRFAIVDRVPVEEITLDEAKAIYWLLSSMVARPVAQKLDGTMIYDVHDTGQKTTPGSGIRPDKTNIELNFHNDNSYNRTPPDYVGLLCWRAARQGGRSKVMSFYTAHNEMLRRHPDLLPRLYRPFWFDRQREFFAGESPIFSAPVLEYDGVLKARLSHHQVRSGYTLKGDPMDTETSAALDALRDIFDDEALSIDFEMIPGRLQYVHNRATGHSRTAFEDHPEPDRRRHLVRLWLRDEGRRAYPG